MKFLFLLMLVLASTLATRAATWTNITATTKANICGDLVVETPAEDCEGTNLNNNSCSTLGYGGGTLSCDISCSFDTFLCLSPTPSPSPTTSSSSSSSSDPTPTPTPTPTPAPTPTLPIIVSSLVTLPAGLLNLMNEVGVVTLTTQSLSDLQTVIRTWVDSWHGNTNICDINNDSTCNLVDISILLFYTDR